MKDNSNSQGYCQLSGVTGTGVIYKITCTISGKIYVGQTKQKLDTRMTQHKYDSKKGSPGIGAAIRKFSSLAYARQDFGAGS